LNDADPINHELSLDYLTYLPGSVLAKVDRAAMAHGLEVRPPFLDPDFVSWSFAQPSYFKLSNGRSKYLLKLAARQLLPKSIVNRKKRGFAIPLARWLCGPLADSVSACLGDSPLWEFLDRETFAGWRQEHRERQADRSKPLWAMLVLDRWMRRFGCRL
jgi:asparagine synthase (glutamine-hydrolysing)